MQVGDWGCSKVGFCGTMGWGTPFSSVGLGVQSLGECKPWLWDRRGTGHWHSPRGSSVTVLL